MSEKVCVLNCPINLCQVSEALALVQNSIKKGESFQIVTINPEMIMNAQNNQEFLEIIKNSDLNIPDGVGVEVALKMRKINLARIRGVDFSRELIRIASENNYRVAFLGAKEEVIQKAKENFLTQYPDLNMVYVRNGYFESENEIIEELKQANPQILLVGLGSPKQEELISKLKNILKGCAMVGVGGSFDVFSGLTKESPIIFRKLGLEWLYRTIGQPERFKRIFPTLPIFTLKCIIETMKKKG